MRAGSRVRCIHNFFIHFEVNLSEYGSYSLHIHRFWYIHKQHLFASFSLQTICTNLYTNIQFHAKKKFILKQIFASERIFTSYFLMLANICYKIFTLKQIFAKLQAIFTYKRMFACHYSHTSKYLLANIHILANICYILFQIILESLSQVLGLN